MTKTDAGNQPTNNQQQNNNNNNNQLKKNKEIMYCIKINSEVLKILCT